MAATAYRIGNLRALADAVIAQAEREGNEAEHFLGVEIVNLARSEGMTEEQIWQAISTKKEG